MKVRVLQRYLNAFFARSKLGYRPLLIDGTMGERTKERIRDAKYYLGYLGNPNAKVTNEFLWRLRNPRKRRPQMGVGTKDLARGADRRIRRRKAVRAKSWNWAWGGCRGLTDEIVGIVGNRAVITSRKRSWGTWGSDHNVAQVRADAVDFGIANAHWLKHEISRKLGGPAYLGDYGSFLVVRRKKRFRVQMIAGTHGTGPHLHVGVRRV